MFFLLPNRKLYRSSIEMFTWPCRYVLQGPLLARKKKAMRKDVLKWKINAKKQFMTLKTKKKATDVSRVRQGKVEPEAIATHKKRIMDQISSMPCPLTMNITCVFLSTFKNLNIKYWLPSTYQNVDQHYSVLWANRSTTHSWASTG